MFISTVWHLEKEGRVLYIDYGGLRKDAAILIARPSLARNYKDCLIRAGSHDAKKILKLKNYLSLSFSTGAIIGPYLVKADPLEAPGSDINIWIDNVYYYCSGIPKEWRVFESEMTMLFPADLPPDSSEEMAKYLRFSRIRKIILSGRYSSEWKTILSPVCHVEEKTAPQQQLFFN